MNKTARVSILLVAIMLFGGYLRIIELQDMHPEKVTLAGDAIEYQWYVSHILKPLPVPPPDRMPGLPLLLVPAFAMLPGSYDAIQAWTTMFLSVALIAAMFQLAVVRVGREYALLVALLVAVNPVLVHNAARGLTEELFLLCMTAALLLYSRIMDGSSRTNLTYALLGVCGGALALTRYDSAPALLPLFLAAAAVSWRDGRWQERAWRILPLGLLPFLFLAASRWYAEAQGFQNIVWRTGNRFFWQEFLRGRLPYNYMFYAEITMKDWLLDYHSLWDLTHMVLMGTVHTVISVGEVLGGQAMLVAAVAGAVLCIVKWRDWALPFCVVLILLPQYAFGRFHGEDDMFRYLLRALPFVILLSVVTLRALVEWLGQHSRWPQFLQGDVRTAALLSSTVILLGWMPGSLYKWAMPQVSQAWHVARFKSTEKDVAEIWNAFVQRRMPADRLIAEAERLREIHPDWAPTHLVLGVAEHSRGNPAAAIEHLQEALRLAPHFAEAGGILAECHFEAERWADVQRVTNRMIRLRPDHPTAYLLQGHAEIIAGRAVEAQVAYRRYLDSNRNEIRKALERRRRHMLRMGYPEAVPQINATLEGLDDDPVSGQLTPILWNFLLEGLGLVLPPMHDQDTYYNLGLAAGMQGDLAEAERRWKDALAAGSRHGLAWGNLAVLYARQGQTQKAFDWLKSPPEALVLAPSIRDWLRAQVAAQSGDQRSADVLFERAAASAATDPWDRATMQSLQATDRSSIAYLPPRVILPMTKGVFVGH